jgi:5-methyltetrahydropteroyltriglutamate--homocysteine methyltransferase
VTAGSAAAKPVAGGMGELAGKILPTTVIGSFAVPEWLGQLKNDFYQRRISARQLGEILDMATKAAIVDQATAGLDIISDGELRRDNDVDYVLPRLPGVHVVQPSKSDYLDYLDATVDAPLPGPGGPGGQGLGIADDFRFARQLTDVPLKVSMTGPFSLSRRMRGDGYGDQGDLVRALARDLHAEAADLAAAGARVLQIDEPFLAGYPEQAGLAIDAVNIVTDVPGVTWVLHVCYGNRYARPLWEGHYDFLFPAVKEARIDQLALEFARRGDEELELLDRFGWDRGLGLGVIDVRSEQVETAQEVAARIRRALRYVPPERLAVNPDCGLRGLTGDAARGKLAALVAGTAQVRSELSGTAGLSAYLAPGPCEPTGPRQRAGQHSRLGGQNALPHLARGQLPAARLADRQGAARAPLPAQGAGT